MLKHFNVKVKSYSMSVLDVYWCSLNTAGLLITLCAPHKRGIFTITTCSWPPWYALFNNLTFSLFASAIQILETK